MTLKLKKKKNKGKGNSNEIRRSTRKKAEPVRFSPTNKITNANKTNKNKPKKPTKTIKKHTSTSTSNFNVNKNKIVWSIWYKKVKENLDNHLGKISKNTDFDNYRELRNIVLDLDNLFENLNKELYIKSYFHFDLKNIYDKWKLKNITNFYAYKIFERIYTLLFFYNIRKEAINKKNKHRIIKLYLNLEKRSWLATELSNELRKIIKNIVEELKIEYEEIDTPLITDRDIQKMLSPISGKTDINKRDKDIIMVKKFSSISL